MIYWPSVSTVTGATRRGRRAGEGGSVFSAWKIFQLLANALQLALDGDANATRSPHGALDLSLALQQTLQIGLELHRYLRTVTRPKGQALGCKN